jgi:hypothetical protein
MEAVGAVRWGIVDTSSAVVVEAWRVAEEVAAAGEVGPAHKTQEEQVKSHHHTCLPGGAQAWASAHHSPVDHNTDVGASVAAVDAFAVVVAFVEAFAAVGRTSAVEVEALDLAHKPGDKPLPSNPE